MSAVPFQPQRPGPPRSSSSSPSSASRRDPRRPRHKKFIVKLTPVEREELTRRIQNGSGPKRDLVRAKVLLLSDISDQGPALTDQELSAECGLSVRTIETLRRRFIEDGLQSAVSWRR